MIHWNAKLIALIELHWRKNRLGLLCHYLVKIYSDLEGDVRQSGVANERFPDLPGHRHHRTFATTWYRTCAARPQAHRISPLSAPTCRADKVWTLSSISKINSLFSRRSSSSETMALGSRSLYSVSSWTRRVNIANRAETAGAFAVEAAGGHGS